MSVRKKVTEAIGKAMGIPEDKIFDKNHPYHYKNYQDNLFCPMAEQAMQSYSKGSGNELQPYQRSGKQCPAKMSSIASSSAMTFNLLGDGPAVIKGKHLPQGAYQVQYEKQMYTLNIGSNPANLDAFLSSELTKTAIFCEMKLLEWLNSPGALKDSYQNPTYYFTPDTNAVSQPLDAYDVFNELANILKGIGFQRYDAWQMFKHLLAIYNYTSFTTQKAVEDFRKIPSMAGKYDCIILANVVNEFPKDRIDEKVREGYVKYLEQEQKEQKQFNDAVKESRIAQLFENNCKASIEVKYLSAKDFAEDLEMTAQKRNYLQRYF